MKEQAGTMMLHGRNRSRHATSASPVERRGPWRAALAGLLVLLCLAGYEWAPSAVAGLTTVQHVSIAGTSRLHRRDILALLDLPGKSSLLLLDRGRLERQVEAHPWVASASVGRALPHTLSVIVVERKPAALARHADGAWVVDGEGVVLASSAEWPTRHLPTFVGLPDAPLLAGDAETRARVRTGLEFADCLRRRFGRAVTVDVSDARFLSGRTGALDILVRDDFRTAWTQYLSLESSLPEARRQTPREIDLRFVGTVIVRQKG